MAREKVRHSVGRRIKYVRTKRGITLEKLAQLSGVSKSFIFEVEQARSDIGVGRLILLADALGVPVAFLITGEIRG